MKKFICCFLSVMLLMGCGIFTSAVSDVQDNTWNKEGYTLVKRETIGLSNDESEVLAENTGNRQIVDCKESNPANICFDGDDIEFLKSLANQSVLGEKEEEAALTREAIERANLRNELIVDGIIFLDESFHFTMKVDFNKLRISENEILQLERMNNFINDALDCKILSVDKTTLELSSCEITEESLELIKQMDVEKAINLIESKPVVLGASHSCSLTKLGFGNMVRANRQNIRNYYNQMVELKYSNPKIVPYYATCQYWYAKIQPGGVWDYKVQSPYKPYNKYFCMTYGINDSKKNYHRTSEFMGNYNYGFTGRVLFNLTTLKLGSNYAASGNPFIPDTDDYPAIEEGYNDSVS